MFYDINETCNLDVPCWKYKKLYLDQCAAELWYQKNDIYQSQGVLQIPLHFKLRYIWTKASNIETLWIFSQRNTYQLKYINWIHRFGRPVAKLFIIKKFILTFHYERWGNLVTTNDQKWLSPNIC